MESDTNKQKSYGSDTETKSYSETKHRKRRSSSGRKSKSVTDETPRTKYYSDQISSPKCKTGRHLCKEIDRLVEENRLLSLKLKDVDAKSENHDKDVLLNKVRNKYHKLEKNYQKLQEDHSTLSAMLEHCKLELAQFKIHNDETVLIVSHLEQERDTLISNIGVLKNENNQCNEDIVLLKNVVYRLNVELERYQDKLRVIDRTLVESSKNDDISQIKNVGESWGKVNLHALGPLLEAYSQNLREKEELIAQYKQEIDHFSGSCKEVVNENEILHKTIESLRSKYDQYVDDMKILGEDAKVIKEQNDLLIKQVNLQKQKLQEIHSIYEQKVESMSQDNNKLHKNYLVCKTELSNVQGKYEILNDGYEKMKNDNEKTMPVSVHAAAVDECKRLFEELKAQYDSEKRKLSLRVKFLEDTHQEDEKLLITVQSERDQFKQQVKMLEKSLKRVTHKLEYFQTTIFSMEISRDSFKRQLSKTTAFCEELVTEQEGLIAEKDRLFTLLKEREKENDDIQFLGNNITERMGTLKGQLKSMQKSAQEQLATVEKQIKTQEANVDQMKLEHYREVQRLKHIINNKNEIIRKLQNEKFQTQDNLELILKSATNDGAKVKDALKNTKMYNL